MVGYHQWMWVVIIGRWMELDHDCWINVEEMN